MRPAELHAVLEMFQPLPEIDWRMLPSIRPRRAAIPRSDIHYIEGFDVEVRYRNGRPADEKSHGVLGPYGFIARMADTKTDTPFAFLPLLWSSADRALRRLCPRGASVVWVH